MERGLNLAMRTSRRMSVVISVCRAVAMLTAMTRMYASMGESRSRDGTHSSAPMYSFVMKMAQCERPGLNAYANVIVKLGPAASGTSYSRHTTITLFSELQAA
jgi:hypothetical protein